MTKLVLSSSNIMSMGGPAIRHPTAQRSNIEFTSSLKTNFAAAQDAASHSRHHNHQHSHHHHHHHHQDLQKQSNGASSQPNGETVPARPPYTTWTSQKNSTIYIPALDFSHTGLAEERPAYEITVKLFFLTNKPAACRCAQTREAIKYVLDDLHVPSIDLLIVSFPGISFDAEDSDGENDLPGNVPVEQDTDNHAQVEDIDTMIKTWECLEQLHDEGVIGRLGLSEFGVERLTKFLKKARVRPLVDQINVKDCCVVPKPLILFAKQQSIELLTHSDCTNILPRGTVRELLGSGDSGANVLADGSTKEDPNDPRVYGGVEPQWVIKYTAIVKDRGVVENKGYFAVAEVRQGH